MSKNDFWQTGGYQKVCIWIHHGLGTGILVDYHEDNMIPQFQLMTNHGAQMAGAQSRLPGLTGQWTSVKQYFSQMD